MQIVNVWPGTPPYLGFGRGAAYPGIRFQVEAQPPGAVSGKFQFVQLVTSSRIKFLGASGTVNAGGGPGQSPIVPTNPGLGNWYPYAAMIGDSNRAGDAPAQSLSFTAPGAQVGEGEMTFGATMYLMWDPALPGPDQTGGCQAASNDPVGGSANPVPSTCTGSIPVPLGYLSWGFTGDAVNTLSTATPGTSNNTGWLMVNCGGPSPAIPTVQPNSEYRIDSYPRWNFVFVNTMGVV